MSNIKMYLPKFHIVPHEGRLNDPIGLGYFNNEFHIFYQNNPFSTKREKTYWGHYTTKDFSTYKFHGLAIAPDTKYDKDGAYSGSAIEFNNKIYLFYTGNVKHSGDYDYVLKGREAYVIRMESDDGINYTNKRIILSNNDYPSNLSLHVRDPYVYKEGEFFYMILGARTKNDKSSYIVYKSSDLLHFELVEQHISYDFGYMFECPSLFTLNNRKVYSFSPQGVEEETNKFKNIFSSGYCLDRINKRKYKEWDLGYDFYAPQVFKDNQGRKIIIGWAGLEGCSYSYLEENEGWKHCLTLPRELVLIRNKIYQKPIKEITDLYGEFIETNCFKGEKFIAKINITKKTTVTISDSLIISFNKFSFNTHFINGGGDRPDRKYNLSIHNVEIIYDVSICEIYFNDGEFVFTTRIYGDNHSVIVEGDSAFIAPIKSANFE